jgi:hypothetical protein
VDLNEIPRGIVRDDMEPPTIEMGDEIFNITGDDDEWYSQVTSATYYVVLPEDITIEDETITAGSYMMGDFDIGDLDLTATTIQFTGGRSPEDFTDFQPVDPDVIPAEIPDDLNERGVMVFEATGYLDNVFVFVMEGEGPEYIFIEDFEGDFDTVPVNWENRVITGTGWLKGSTSDGSDGVFVYHDDDIGYNDAWLITPQIVLPDNETIELSFSQMGGFNTWYEYHGIWISTTDSSSDSFIRLQELGPADPIGWSDIIIDISEYRGESIYLAFVYRGDWADRWYIDNVVVE